MLMNLKLKLLKKKISKRNENRTVAKEENDQQVDWILENLPLQLVSLEGCVCEELLKDCKREGVLQLLPGREKTDGFFLAKFQKR